MTQQLDNREGLPVCPSCGGYIPNNETPGAFPGAISRKDNTTEICSICGTREALEGKIPEDDIEAIIHAVQGVTTKEVQSVKDIYIDLDSGTVLNGPIFKVSGVYSHMLDDESDEAARLVASLYGKEMK